MEKYKKGMPKCIQTEKNALSIRSNDIIQNSRYLLTRFEEDIVTYLTAQIHIKDERFGFIEFTIPDFCRACGINPTSGNNYEAVKEAITRLKSRVIWLDYIDEDGNVAERAINWLGDAVMVKGTGKVRLKFDDQLKPHLLQQVKNFTVYEPIYQMHLRTEYSKRLYLFCKSKHFYELERYTHTASLETLMLRLGAVEIDSTGNIIRRLFPKWQKFKERCLEPAIAEVNNGTDITIAYDKVTQGRSVVGVKLTIEMKDAPERLRIHAALKGEIIDAEL